VSGVAVLHALVARVRLDEALVAVDGLGELVLAEVGVGDAELRQRRPAREAEGRLDVLEVLDGGDPVRRLELLDAHLVVLLGRRIEVRRRREEAIGRFVGAGERQRGDNDGSDDGAGLHWTRHPPRRRAGCQMVYDAAMTRRVAPLLIVIAAGCASGGHKSELAAVPPPSSSGPLVTAGPRCAGATCKCREIDDY